MKEFMILRQEVNEGEVLNPSAVPAAPAVPEENEGEVLNPSAVPAAPAVPEENEDETFAQRKSRIIRTEKADGARTINATCIGCGVGDLNASGARSLSFSLDKRVKMMDETMATVLWDTTFGLFSQLKHNPSYARFMPIIEAHPVILQVLIPGSQVTFLLKDVVAGELFCNPFSERPNMVASKDNRTYAWLTDVVLSAEALQFLQQILFGMVDINRLESNLTFAGGNNRPSTSIPAVPAI